MGFQTTFVLLLCIFTLQCSTQNIYFVIPTPDAPCPVEPCLTLAQYVEEIDLYLTSNTTLLFSPGHHILEANVSFQNVTGLVLLGSSSASLQIISSIVCRRSAAIEFFQTDSLRISFLAFDSCGVGDATSAVSMTSASATEVSNCIFGNSTSRNGSGGGLALEDSIVSLTENVFEHNSAYSGGAVYVSNSNVTFERNNFSRNSAVQGGAVSIVNSRVNFLENRFSANLALAIGGGAIVLNSTAIFAGNGFADNIADSVGGGVYLVASSIGNFTEETFQNNVAYYSGGGVYVFESTAEFYLSTFTDNKATEDGGGVYVADSTTEFCGNIFVNNEAGSSGGGIRVTSFNAIGKSNITLHQNILRFNSATFSGGAMNIDNCLADISEKNVFAYNHAGNLGGGFFLEDSVVNFAENSLTNNLASTDSGGCGYIQYSAVDFSGNTFVACWAGNEGGALRVASSTMSFVGDCFHSNVANLGGAVFILANTNASFCNSTAESNFAEYGGVVTSFDSSVEFTGKNTFKRNAADYGGGLYLTNSNLQISGQSNFLDNWSTYGGGLYASRSNIHFRGNTNFAGNSAALEGGGFLLTADSVTHLLANTSISLTNNTAENNGGAIRVEDSNPLTYCFETLQYRSECFFQLEGDFTLSEALDIASSITVNFVNNFARLAGSDLYGGAVDSCIISRYTISGKEIFGRFISNINESAEVDISSDPLRICFCNTSTGEVDCSDSTRSVYAIPGGTLTISAIALGQTDDPVPAIVHAILSENKVTLQDLQNTQSTDNTCSTLHYNIYSSVTNISEVMTLFADGPCPPDGRSLSIDVEIRDCPHGFELSDKSQSCVCHERLRRFTDNCVLDDESMSGTIFRTQNAEFWVGFDPSSQELILHPNCPFDFCTTEPKFISVDDSDVQCNYNRTGLLCGGCPDNFSLVLGSSHCHQCSNKHLAFLLIFAFAGIALIAFIFILKLTVAAGTISGLIFYANLIQVNSAVFFPADTTNFLTVFIAWLNLDFGIRTCFYDGMDAYSKIWLQFVFPIYIWSLVGLIFLVSHYSVRIANMIGDLDPVPILATLFFISYAKILRTIIAALSVTSLEYADGSYRVWVYDGNIRYCTGKHVPLFLTALFFLLFLFLPYTLFLFLGQWLPRLKWKGFSWINGPKVRWFLDAHHAPYVLQHRYWTGLLLLVRCIVFLIIAVYGRDKAVSLLVVTVAALALVTTSLLTGGVYKSRFVGAVEAFFFLNLGVLAVGMFYVQLTGGNQAAVAFTSVGIAFLLFAGVVTYQLFVLYVQGTKMTERLSDLYQSFRKKKKNMTVDNTEPVRVDSNDQPIGPTSTWVEFREPILESI